MKLNECSVSPFSVDYLGQILLHVAVDHGHLDLTKQLISEGLKIDQKDKSGCTAMQLAKCLGTQDLQRLLLSLRCRERATYLNDHAANFALMQSCPEPIANAMFRVQGRNIEALYRDQASLFFSDIVRFTAIRSKMEQARLSSMLDAPSSGSTGWSTCTGYRRWTRWRRRGLHHHHQLHPGGPARRPRRQPRRLCRGRCRCRCHRRSGRGRAGHDFFSPQKCTFSLQSIFYPLFLNEDGSHWQNSEKWS